MSATIERHNGTPTLMLDGQPQFCSYLWSGGPDRDGFENADIARAYAEAGIHFHAFDVGTGGVAPEWCGPAAGRADHHDFGDLTERFGRVIDADPEARFHLRVHLRQREWWRNLYPDEWEVPSEPVSPGPLAQSFASTVWRQQANDFLRAYADAIQQAGLADRVFAYQVGAGNTGEWVKGDISMDAVCGDYSAPMVTHFRQWLRDTYGDVEALRDAWQDGEAHFDTAGVPSGEAQRQTLHFTFRDPLRERPVIDYYRCLAELCGDLVIDFCRTVKEATRGQALAGAFFGYLLELAWNKSFFAATTDSEYSTTQRSGHLGLRQALRSEHVDFLVSPYSYGFRGIGGDGVAMQPQDSLRLHNTLYVFEDDTRVHIGPKDGRYGRVDDMAGSTSVLTRNFAQIVTRGQAVWWHSAVDPVREPALAPLLARFQQIGTWALGLDRSPEAEIAVIVDDESFYYETIRNDLDLPLIFQQRLMGLPRLGAPFDTYLLDDLCEGRMPEYRLYIFLNPLRLDRARRDALARQLRRDGKVALWIYGAGYIEETPALENMTDLTGFDFDCGSQPWGPLVHILDFDHEITRDLTQDLFWGTNSILGPVFHLADTEARVLGQVVYSEGRCVPGFAVKDLDGWTSVWSAAPNIPASVLRGLARFAGVHLYGEAGDVLHATHDLLSLHTISGGPRTVRLPHWAEVVYDLFGREIIARDTDRFDTHLPPRSTTVYFTGPVEVLHQLDRDL